MKDDQGRALSASKTKEPTAVITEIDRRTANFAICDLDVAAILKSAEVAVRDALKEKGIRGNITRLELRLIEWSEHPTGTRVVGDVQLGEVVREPSQTQKKPPDP
jgi:hypothetical protein